MRLKSLKADPALPALALTPTDTFDVASFLTHIMIVGQTGSGRSSAVLRTSACRFGAGMICPAYKADAADDIERWARGAGSAAGLAADARAGGALSAGGGRGAVAPRGSTGRG